jgi:hypothetical protein
MPAWAKCRVSYTNEEGIHSVEVAADTLFEAAAQAQVEFREDKTIMTAPDLQHTGSRGPTKAC